MTELLALLNAVLLWRAVMRKSDTRLFCLALTFFALGFAGLLLGIWPNLTIWAAAAPPSSQDFVLVGALIMLPVVVI